MGKSFSLCPYPQLVSNPTRQTSIFPGVHSTPPRSALGPAFELLFLESAFICRFLSCQPNLETGYFTSSSDISSSESGSRIWDGQCSFQVPLLWAARTLRALKLCFSLMPVVYCPSAIGALPSCRGARVRCLCVWGESLN